MHQTVEKIIDRLMGAVKTDKPYYALKDLISAGFPPFIVERIRVRLNEKIEEDLIFPQTEWAELELKLVAEAWEDFQQTAFSNSRIPKEELYTVTGSVITEIVKVYLEPRQHMAEYIYKGTDELDFNELESRTNRLTIYKHFGRAIPLYMQKRNLKTLEKKRCKLLIHNLDASLVASYSAEDWAQVLKLLFDLFGGKIHSSLIQLFFEDKGLFLTAKTFNELNEEINQKRFVEILSYPDLLNVQLQEKFRDKYREELIAQKNRFDQPDKEVVGEIDEKEQKLLDSFLGDYKEEEPLTNEESLNALFRSEQNDKSIVEDLEGSNGEEELIKPSTKEKAGETQRFRENLTSVLDLAASSYQNLAHEEEEPKVGIEKKSKDQKKPVKGSGKEKKKPSPKKKKAEAPEEKQAEDADEKPMWQQFISPEQMDLVMGNKEDEQDDESGILVEEDDFIDEPIVDFSSEGEATVPDLRVHLLGQEVFYIEELFEGSESTYERVLARIIVHDNWEEAAEYIQKEVFSSEKIDMYSDAAVDFTDQLHSYFKEYKN
ncbi:MAG: hypothetical protein WD059_02170 [Balneolaceae bacterium]